VKPLRLAMIVERFWPRVGGLETRAAELACELADRGVEITVVTARWHAEWPAEIAYHGLPVVRLAPPPTGRWKAWRWTRSLARWLRCNGDHFDVALVWGMLGEARAAIEALTPRVPVVLVPDGNGWQGDCFRQVRAAGARGMQRACRQAAALIAASRAARQELEAAGYSREKIHDVPPGVPALPPRTPVTRTAAREMLADASPALQLGARSLLAVSTTRLAAGRGWETLLAAWSIVARQRSSARLWLVGEAPQAAEVCARIDTLGLSQTAELVGKFDEVAQLLSAADLLVSPAPDGGPRPILEAMAAGIPAVAADVPVNRWLLGDDAAGVLVPPDDAQALAAAIVELFDDAAAAERMGNAGWQRVQREFTLTAMADRLCEVLDRTLRPLRVPSAVSH
jgi:glycosyltransferase involved in cell wall biosynthesis